MKEQLAKTLSVTDALNTDVKQKLIFAVTKIYQKIISRKVWRVNLL